MFFRCHGKKRQKLGEFFKQFDRLIDTIDSVCTDGSMAIGQRRLFLERSSLHFMSDVSRAG